MHDCFLDRLSTLLAEHRARQADWHQARVRFAPQLCYGRHFGPAAANCRHAAVLALLYRHQNQWYVPLTLRPPHMSAHAGQISFPGGMLEQGESFQQGALREWEEELGTPATQFRFLGTTSPLYVFGSNFLVTPCLAQSFERPQFQPNPEEVAEVLELPVPQLLDPRNYEDRPIRRRGLQFTAPHIVHDRHAIWGATCMILGELIALLREAHRQTEA